mgnify:FL=1
MEFTIKLNSPELQNLIESGTLLKVLKENTFGGVDAETEQPLGQVAFDLTNPDKPALEVPVTDQEVTVEEVKPTVAPTANKTYTKDELAQAAAQLLDKGMLTELQNLIKSFGVISLGDLPDEHLGAYALGLRELGAEI